MKRQFVWMLLVGVFLTGGSLLAAYRGQSQIDKKTRRPEVDFTRFPIVDGAATEPGDAAAQAKRAKKGKKYNTKYLPVITESYHVAFLVNESLVGLPALPIDKSSVVLLGEIVDAKAHLSEDRTAVYSEFEVRIQRVFKNTSKRILAPGSSVEVERYGGRVRLPSGKIVISAVDHQDMPLVGSVYLLFLTNDLLSGGRNDDDFQILMGYESKNGKVFPLDKTTSNHPISRYSGLDESVLLADLTSALSVGSTTSSPK